jgi:class 3 adenylate cyclase/HAMP domain-containing protein
VNIRAKIIFVVLPVLVTALVATGTISSFSARAGMTRIAMDFLSFKGEEIENYATSQWSLLVSNGYQDQPNYVAVSKEAVQSYAATIIKSPTEKIFALDPEGNPVISTSPVNFSIRESARLYTNLQERKTGWITFSENGLPRVGHAFFFEPFSWYVVVSEDQEVFSREAAEIVVRTAMVLGLSILISIAMLFMFTGFLTRPLRNVVSAMKNIIRTNDLSQRVPVMYRDEIGTLAHTFNLMTGELEKAYDQIKSFAYKAVLAEKNEHKVRNIFQKYVPKNVIDSFFVNPEKMLLGDNRVVAILFSDIRSFTTISEGFMPDELVAALNRYFAIMVDIIMNRGGIIDKYIGDAIMAFYGAPVKRDDDALQALMSALDMQEALDIFNAEQTAAGKPAFKTGIGINYGVVTVGNIGSERKMDYTIIGDMVNLGSRLEGLTKPYQQGVIFSESVYRKVKDKIPCRMVDKVVVKGKTKGENIYTAKKGLSAEEVKAWKFHHAGLALYYRRKFREAKRYFSAADKYLGKDFLAEMYLKRCDQYISAPPPAEWSGVEVLTSK